METGLCKVKNEKGVHMLCDPDGNVLPYQLFTSVYQDTGLHGGRMRVLVTVQLFAELEEIKT